LSIPHVKDPAEWHESSETPDMAAEIDSLVDICRDRAGEYWRKVGVPGDRRQLVERTGDFAALICQERDQSSVMGHAMESFRRVLATVIDAGEDALLQARCADFAIGTMVQGPITEQWIADQHGLTRAAVSKRCVLLRDEFGLPPSAGMRSPQACKTYGMRQRGKRTVIQKVVWPFTSLLTQALKKAS